MYSKIEVFGGCDIGYIYVQNKEDSSHKTEELKDSNINLPVWNSDDVMLATFENSENKLAATRIPSLNGDLVGYRIQRYDLDTGKTTNVVLNLNNISGIIRDYNVASNKRYKYYIYPVTKDENGNKALASPLVSGEIAPMWDMAILAKLNYSETDNEYIVDEDNIWHIYMNLSQEQYELQMDKIFTDGFSRFPKRSQGMKRYVRGGVSGIIGAIDCDTYSVKLNVSDIEKWEEFCQSPNLKLYNDMHGRILPVDIESSSISYFTGSADSPITVNFRIVQMDDAKNISAYRIMDKQDGE